MNNELIPQGKLPEYEHIIRHFSYGPQKEGLSLEELQTVLEDDKTEYVEVELADGSKHEVPFLVDVEHARWINPDFLSKKGYDPADVLYCALPQEFLSGLDTAVLANKLIDITGKRGDITILVDYPETTRPFFQQESSIKVDVDDLETEVQTPAAIYHYQTDCQPLASVEHYIPEPNTKRIMSNDVEEHFERIWEIYAEQFKPLVDDHPVQGMLPKEDLKAVLMASGCRLMAFFDEKNRIQSFGYLVDDVRLCPWLNEKYFNSVAGSRPLVYMSGIATSSEENRPVSGHIMKNLLHETFNLYGSFVLTFECSNRSATYIPRLVQRAFDQSGMISYSDFKETKHYYKVIRPSTKAQD